MKSKDFADASSAHNHSLAIQYSNVYHPDSSHCVLILSIKDSNGYLGI